jgi:general secretion pathway protein G
MVLALTLPRRGFTLIELLVVMAVLGLLLSIAAPRYTAYVDRSRETVLRHNLAGLRDAIDRFHADKARYPKDLEELVTTKYLRAVPLDPITEQVDTWAVIAPAGASASVYDVRSGAQGNGREGTPYASW